MMILIDSRLFGTKDEKAISIIYNTPLGCPFKIGDQDCITGAVITDRQGILNAYEGWMLYRIETQIPPTIQALDEIAFRVLDGEQVTLSCTCNSELCHGHIIKRIVEDAIRNSVARHSH